MNAPLSPGPPTKNSSLATWSLVLGILGVALVMACVGPLFAIPAVICGHAACKRIKRSNGMLGGEGIAVAGLITGYVGLGVAVVIIPLMATLAIPNFLKARDTAQRNTCIYNLRLIDDAKQQWALENHKNAEDVPTAHDLDKYLPAGFSFESLHCAKGGTYSINRADEAPTCSVADHVLDFHQPFVAARPRQPGPRTTVPPALRPFNFNTNSLLSRLQMKETMAQDRCEANLRLIEIAKRKWALGNHKKGADIPTLYELIPYLPGHHLPVCPSGGTYSFGTMDEPPKCTVTEHRFPKRTSTRNPTAPTNPISSLLPE